MIFIKALILKASDWKFKEYKDINNLNDILEILKIYPTIIIDYDKENNYYLKTGMNKQESNVDIEITIYDDYVE